MNDSLTKNEVSIPEYITLGERKNCNSCHEDYCNYGSYNHPSPPSMYDCPRFMIKISRIKFVLEALFFVFSTFSFISTFSGFWKTILKIALVFLSIIIIDFFTDKLIKSILVSSEKRRRKKYDNEVKKIKEENEAIKKANLGITGEVEKFLDNSKILFDELSTTYDSLKKVLNEESKSEKRVIDKFQTTLKELEILNGKLYDNAFESTYINTLYEIHIPKLLEYAKQFLLFRNSKLLTEKQIVEFSNLLEVFRVKIADHTEYLQNKIEDDFIIKMKALNEDVLPNFDGSEGTNNE